MSSPSNSQPTSPTFSPTSPKLSKKPSKKEQKSKDSQLKTPKSLKSPLNKNKSSQNKTSQISSQNHTKPTKDAAKNSSVIIHSPSKNTDHETETSRLLNTSSHKKAAVSAKQWDADVNDSSMRLRGVFVVGMRGALLWQHVLIGIYFKKLASLLLILYWYGFLVNQIYHCIYGVVHGLLVLEYMPLTNWDLKMYLSRLI